MLSVHGSTPNAGADSQLSGGVLELLIDQVGSEHLNAAHLPDTSRGGVQDALAFSRLGIAAALYFALRCKHRASAAHSMRVALGCSAWASANGMETEERAELEIASLLHDIGKIGVPDDLLLRARRLTTDELAIMDRHRMMGMEILECFCPSLTLRNIIRYSLAWYDGTHPGFDRSGKKLPQSARMLAVMDAFDSMTTDHVYRPALSRERAVAELFEFAGTQFDPQMVEEFSRQEFVSQPAAQLRTASEWLKELDARGNDLRWKFLESAPGSPSEDREHLFHRHLIDFSADGVCWVDGRMQIIRWNDSAARITGVPAESLMQRTFTPSLFGMRNDSGEEILNEDCPVAMAVKSRARLQQGWSLWSRGQRSVRVDAQIVPIISTDGTVHGAIVVMRDASQKERLEKRIANLNEEISLDPLTRVANRAEFDRVHAEFVRSHLAEGTPYSLIICDIDHFKRINDTYGHQAGDEAIQGFAQILKGMTREGDVVARYGGEEFVVLCTGCDNGTAAQRAEQMRAELASIPLEALGGRKITASFGVTEIQAGDAPDTMLRRADRALLKAKESGRNTVVQLGGGVSKVESRKRLPRRWWFFGRSPEAALMERTLQTGVPIAMAMEKLRGFVADHQARLELLAEDRLKIMVSERATDRRRELELNHPMVLEIRFKEEIKFPSGPSARHLAFPKTTLHVLIKTMRARDRRKRDVESQARQLMASLCSYLMVTSEPKQDKSAPWGELGPV